MHKKILFISTPMAPIGSQAGGGVETTLRYLPPVLAARGHEVAVIAPMGSRLPPPVRLYAVEGTPPASATTGARDTGVSVDPAGMVERMWGQAAEMQGQYDVILSQAYDWLSYYLTPFFSVPVLHWVSLSSGIEAVDKAILACHRARPDRIAFYSRTQAATYSFIDAASARVVSGAVDTDRFRFCAEPERALVWSGRISPEKGVEDAVAVAHLADMTLHICGKIENAEYWDKVQAAGGKNTIVYHGPLAHDKLAEVLGGASAMLMLPKWVEAFGLTVIEALSCGTPVITYNEGGPGEIVEHGKSGFLVPRGDLAAAAHAVARLGRLNRQDARRRAEDYSYDRMADRIEAWIESAAGIKAR